MTTHARRSPRPADLTEEARDRLEPDPDERLATPPLEVMDVVHYGTGRGSRIELTIVVGDERVRLRGLLGNRVLSYRYVANAAMEQSVVLPYLRPANEVWRQMLAPAMKRARLEPLLEGEEVADAVAAEIRSLLKERARGRDASDFKAGKVVERGEWLLVCPSALAEAVRQSLVDDVLPQATIAEAASAYLGMRESRPSFRGPRIRHRFRAWAFPLPLRDARRHIEGEPAGDGRVVPFGSNGSSDGPEEARVMSRPANELCDGSAGSTENVSASETRSAAERPFVGE